MRTKQLQIFIDELAHIVEMYNRGYISYKEYDTNSKIIEHSIKELEAELLELKSDEDYFIDNQA